MLPLRATAAAAVLLAIGSAGISEELPAALQASFEAGVQALKTGKLDEAEAAFQGVLRRGGEVAYVHNNLGIVYRERAQHEPAIAEFRKAIHLDPSYVAPRVGVGASLLALGRIAEAITELEPAVRLAPRDPLARMQLAKAYERDRNWPDAIEQYRALRDIGPREPEHAYRLGKAYLALSEWCLRELKLVDPSSARLQQALGHNYRMQGRVDLALRAFERAAQADPALPEIHLAMAQIHLEQKRWADARQEIEKELALVPESAGARALQQRLLAEQAKSP
jgi:tetratricopeptide (TPR) repeat protein